MHIPIRRYLRLLFDYLRPQWPKVLLLAALLAGGTVLQLYTPQILRRFLDTAISGAGTSLLPWLAAGFILLSLLSQVLAALTRYVGEQVSWTATNRLRADLAAHCLRLDLGFHKARTPGEMVERIDGDVTQLSNFFSQMSVDVLGSLLLAVGVLAALFREDWRAGAALSLFAGATILVLWSVRTWAAPIWARSRQAAAEFYGFLGEQLAATETIRSSGSESHVMNQYLHRFRGLTWLAVRSSLTRCVMWGSSFTIFAAGDAVTLGLGAYLYSRGAISVGTVYLLFHYTQLLGKPLEQIRTQLQDLQAAGASVERVAELTGTVSRVADGPGAPLPTGSLSLSLRDVSFGYEPGDTVLDGITLELKPGEVLGLLGRTGSGKSTLARLLLRFYDPTAGEIELGGTRMVDLTLRQLRSRVGLVTQDVQLLAASVRENLTFFDSTIPDERILAVLADLGLTPWLRSLPDGLGTHLGGSGSLSAGEAQLLAFARVFLSDPGLVILDEASSRLDPATESLVERAVDRLLAGRTGIIIAHRLSTVDRADRILILDAGKVLEAGDREALAADPNSHFHRLLDTGLEEVLA